MNMKISARHMDLTDALKGYADKKVAHFEKFASRIGELEVIFSAEGQKKNVELIAHTAHHNPIVVHVADDDAYAAMDIAVDKMARQLKRDKEMAKNHRNVVGASQASLEAVQTRPEDEEPQKA